MNGAPPSIARCKFVFPAMLDIPLNVLLEYGIGKIRSLFTRPPSRLFESTQAQRINPFGPIGRVLIDVDTAREPDRVFRDEPPLLGP
jgi:hypothetical protein